jgi:hypothetical protein
MMLLSLSSNKVNLVSGGEGAEHQQGGGTAAAAVNAGDAEAASRGTEEYEPEDCQAESFYRGTY